MKNLIGRKILGFRFESRENLEYTPNMNAHIGEIGQIVSQVDTEVVVRFNKDRYLYHPPFDNGQYLYPLPEAIDHLVEEEPVIPELEGVKMEVSYDGNYWAKRIVFGTYKGNYLTLAGSYTHARPIQEVKKLTMEELELIVGFKFEIV